MKTMPQLPPIPPPSLGVSAPSPGAIPMPPTVTPQGTFTGPGPFAATPAAFSASHDIAAGFVRTPTALLYQPDPASIGGIIGKHIGAPLYDNISAAVRRLKQRLIPPPVTPITSAQHYIGAAPTAGAGRITAKNVLTATAIVSAGIMACGSNGDLTDAITRALLFNLAGGLGLFLYGLEAMSESMHAVSGDTMKSVLSRLTRNRFAALGVGLGVTSIIQSSSVTTVLTVGAVDAGLINLTQALGVVFGANIGTTMTGWIFAMDISKYGLPLIGTTAITHLFAKKDTVKNVAFAGLGLGLVFLGLETMAAGFKNPEIKEYLTGIFGSMNDASYGGIAKCIVVGAVATGIIQSSSASLGIVMALAKAGILSFPPAAALVLGANIGTTVTAGLAALRPGTATEARQVAMSHFLFNLIGVGLIYPWSPKFIGLSSNLADTMGLRDPATKVAFVHSLFNISASILFLTFLTPFEHLVKRIIRAKATPEELGTRRLSQALLNNPALALEDSRGVVADMDVRVGDMFDVLLATVGSTRPIGSVETDILTAEEHLDHVKRRIYEYANQLVQMSLSPANAVELARQRRITDNEESISDHLKRLFYLLRDKRPHDVSSDTNSLLIRLLADIRAYFTAVSNTALSFPSNPEIWERMTVEYRKLRKLLLEYKEERLEAVAEHQIWFINVLNLYLDILGDIKNIADAHMGRK